MELQFFALGDGQDWGKKIQNHLEIAMSPYEEREFADGEHKARPLVNVRERDVFVIQSLYGDTEESVNDKLCRLLFFVSTLKDASARHVSVVIPYFAYARKDRKTKARDPVTMKYMARLLEASGVDRVITLDVHNLAAFQNAFRIPTEHLEARVLLAPYLANFQQEEIVIVSPDAGGTKRAQDLQHSLSELMQKDIGLAFLEKKRSQDEVEGGNFIIGDVKGKLAIVYDDIIASGKTLKLALDSLSAQGAHRIMVCAAHGIFTAGAEEVIGDPRLEKVLITDSIPPFRLNQELLQQKLMIFDSSRLFARAMKRIKSGESVTDLMQHYPKATQEISMLS